MEISIDVIIKIILSIIFGGLVGLERELKQKPVGLRTNILICIGSTVFMIIGLNIAKTYSGNTDPLRVAAQIITGIGFLGAGSIIRSHGEVRGLTTAASIWVVAGIGLAIGNGYYLLAGLITLSVMFVLHLVQYIEKRLQK